jgi:hypothetical protein
LRTEEPEPESDSCNIRSRLLGALPTAPAAIGTPSALVLERVSGERNAGLSGVGTHEPNWCLACEAPALKDRLTRPCFGRRPRQSWLRPALKPDSKQVARIALRYGPATDGWLQGTAQEYALRSGQARSQTRSTSVGRVAVSTSGLFGGPSSCLQLRPRAAQVASAGWTGPPRRLPGNQLGPLLPSGSGTTVTFLVSNGQMRRLDSKRASPRGDAYVEPLGDSLRLLVSRITPSGVCGKRSSTFLARRRYRSQS